MAQNTRDIRGVLCQKCVREFFWHKSLRPPDAEHRVISIDHRLQRTLASAFAAA